MDSSVIGILVGVVAASLVLKFIKGMIKFAVLAAIVIAGLTSSARGRSKMGYTGPLSDKDRIFTNVYGFQSPDLKAAQARGDWDNTKALMAVGPGRDHRRGQGVGPARARRGGLPDRHEVELHAQGAQARQAQLPRHQRRRIRARDRARTARSSATIRTS